MLMRLFKSKFKRKGARTQAMKELSAVERIILTKAKPSLNNLTLFL